MSLKEPTAEDAIKLFQAIEEKFPSASIGGDKWYLSTISALTGGGVPEFAAELYKYIIAKPEFSTSEARKALVRRLREALVKCVSIVGVCRPLEAIFSIGAIERPEDKDYTFTRKDWQCDEMNHQRGMDWLGKLYKQNLSLPMKRMEAHKDFEWISKEITYGLYLSDRQILDDTDTQMVVLSAIMIQNLKNETAWHLRGTRRVGVSEQDVETIQQCIELIAKFAEVSLHKVPRVADIEHEV
ncbi:hypothetical protein EV356DRAFT_527469 [Viridothelium virens]|uniref:Carboxymuconolactone decarboxylase-like domain-containing protein n=1 Tax=Viridothelium virens TaxID=1048519 RepID=A0A6A6HHX8_VIRVR|nr:hypothetical protein EV356DRAFT_527469 [Viridothelium virens]